MSSKSSPQTQTTTSEPPRYLLPHLDNAAAGAASNYYYSEGAPVVPFSGETEQALQGTAARAAAGSPVARSAQDYAQRTLSGGFMGSNPWLDQAFNKASGAVTNQVQSNFGLSGRNPRGIDAAGFAQEGYNDLAAKIYGGDYQAERARQQQLVPFAGQLAAQDYADLGQMANVGAQREALAYQYANQPNANLDAFIARLGGLSGGYGNTTSQIPTERNWLAGAAGGAMTGATLGTSVFPGLGTGAGAAIGGILGGLGAYY